MEEEIKEVSVEITPVVATPVVEKTQEETLKEMAKDPLVEQAKQKLLADMNLDKVEEMLQQNSIEFDIGKQQYRVRKPTFQEKREAYTVKVEKFNELLNDSKYELEDTLKEKYKKRGINVDDLTARIQNLEGKKNEFQLKLGRLLEAKASEPELKTLKDEIERIVDDQYMISIKKTNLMQFSIESQIMIFAYQFLTCAVTEKLIPGAEGEEGTWVKAWKSFDDFTQADERLVNIASFNASLLAGQL